MLDIFILAMSALCYVLCTTKHDNWMCDMAVFMSMKYRRKECGQANSKEYLWQRNKEMNWEDFWQKTYTGKTNVKKYTDGEDTDWWCFNREMS